ncbi:TPA: Proline transporter [Trebouxia sp. C0006]
MQRTEMNDSAHSAKNFDPEANRKYEPETVSKATVHAVGQDSPWEVGAHMIAALDNAFILGYPYLIMAFLGWGAGSTLFILFGFLSFYCNCCLCRLHGYGGHRNIRFRDLAGRVFGKFGYYLTFTLQWLNLLCANVGLVVLAGQSLKGVFELYDEKYFSLAEWIVVAGAVIGLFAVSVPNLHLLRVWSSLSCLLVLIFSIITIAISCHDGRNNYNAETMETGPKDYSIAGTNADKAFNALGSLGTMAFAYNTVILPEIQATVRAPAARNMITKTLPMMYLIGTLPFLLISFIGYWAYGNEVGYNILYSNSGPTWAIALAYVAAAAQIVVSFHIYACPIYETMDTAWGRKQEGTWSIFNISERFITRVMYLALTTFVAALLPFFGDFIALTGSLSALPLDFVLVLAMTLKVYGKSTPMWLNIINGTLCVLLFFVTIVSSISSIRYIVVDSVTYHVFANL